MGAAAHHVVEGQFLLMSTGRICSFFATVIAVTVVPAVLRGAQGRRLGTSTASTGATAAAAAVVASIICIVGKLKGVELCKKSLHLRLHHGVGLIV